MTLTTWRKNMPGLIIYIKYQSGRNRIEYRTSFTLLLAQPHATSRVARFSRGHAILKEAFSVHPSVVPSVSWSVTLELKVRKAVGLRPGGWMPLSTRPQRYCDPRHLFHMFCTSLLISQNCGALASIWYVVTPQPFEQAWKLMRAMTCAQWVRFSQNSKWKTPINT